MISVQIEIKEVSPGHVAIECRPSKMDPTYAERDIGGMFMGTLHLLMQTIENDMGGGTMADAPWNCPSDLWKSIVKSAVEAHKRSFE